MSQLAPIHKLRPLPAATQAPQAKPLARALAGLALVALLGGCQKPSFTDVSGIATGSIDAPVSIDPAYGASAARAAGRDDPLASYSRKAAEIAIDDGQHYGAVTHLTRVFRSDPSDKDVAYDLARHLRYLGATTEAEQVLAEAMIHHPNDPLLRLELGKARIADGRPREALAVLKPLSDDKSSDPAVLQTLGVAYDRIGDHGAAQAAYRKAIDSGRPHAALLNNYGLSHLLGGDLPKAIEMLRQASASPGAAPQIRRNLAMALALNGEGAEARRIAESVGSKEQAEQLVGAFEDMAAAGVSPADAWSTAAGQ